jgi:uncharacterized membrane protein YheB (UPF0754 family)
MYNTPMFLYLLPIISAGVGWLTNVIAVKMLFHPQKPLYILGIKVQGVIPDRKDALAERLGEIVSDELVSHETIVSLLKESTESDALRVLVESKLDQFLKEKVVAINPMFAMVMNGPILDQIKEVLTEETILMIPELVDVLSGQFEDKLNFKEIVKDKVSDFDLDTLEEIVHKIADKELKHIELYGAILGFMIGLVQLGLVFLVMKI